MIRYAKGQWCKTLAFSLNKYNETKKDVSFDITPFSLYNNPNWYPEGIAILKELVTILIKRDLAILMSYIQLVLLLY